MKQLKFKNSEKFTNGLIKIFEDKLSDHYVCVYGKYDFIKTVLENLIVRGYHIAHEIILQDYDINNYDKEFILSLTEEGIIVENLWHETRYYYSGSKVALIHDECNSKLLKYIQSVAMFEVCICDENNNHKVKDLNKSSHKSHWL